MDKQSQLSKLEQEVIDAKRIVDHWAGRNTRGKPPEEIAHIDEQFFLAEKNLKALKKRRDELKSSL